MGKDECTIPLVGVADGVDRGLKRGGKPGLFCLFVYLAKAWLVNNLLHSENYGRSRYDKRHGAGKASVRNKRDHIKSA